MAVKTKVLSKKTTPQKIEKRVAKADQKIKCQIAKKKAGPKEIKGIVKAKPVKSQSKKMVKLEKSIVKAQEVIKKLPKVNGQHVIGFGKATDSSKEARSLPDDVLFREAKRRKKKLTKIKGLYATMKIFRECQGCHQEFSTRKLRSHRCPSGLGWKKRYPPEEVTAA
jgi:hypothetical protein